MAATRQRLAAPGSHHRGDVVPQDPSRHVKARQCPCRRHVPRAGAQVLSDQLRDCCRHPLPRIVHLLCPPGGLLQEPCCRRPSRQWGGFCWPFAITSVFHRLRSPGWPLLCPLRFLICTAEGKVAPHGVPCLGSVKTSRVLSRWALTVGLGRDVDGPGAPTGTRPSNRLRNVRNGRCQSPRLVVTVEGLLPGPQDL